MTEMTYGIVAGYDGSPGSGEALRWAAREAKNRATTLTVCLAWLPDHMALPTESDLCDGLARQHGQVILARTRLPYAESSASAPAGSARNSPAGRPLRCCASAARPPTWSWSAADGQSELPGLLLGSVAWQVAGHACGRVVVVRGAWRPADRVPRPGGGGRGRIPAAQAAIAFAFEEATWPARRAPGRGVRQLDAVGRLGEGHQMEEDFGQLMAYEAKEHPEGHRGAPGAGGHPAGGVARRGGRRPDARGRLSRPRRPRRHEPRLGRPGRPAPRALPGRSRPLNRVQPLVSCSQAERAWLSAQIIKDLRPCRHTSSWARCTTSGRRVRWPRPALPGPPGRPPVAAGGALPRAGRAA